MITPASGPLSSPAPRVCTRCIMDPSDPDIAFDANGVCSHCRHFEEKQRPNWFPNNEGARRLERAVAQIKADGAGRDYDCIVGLSGGVDSSYLAVKVNELGLRPLVVHVDAGWNSELAVKNIENLVKGLGYDLFTMVIDWEEMRDLQAAFLRAGVPNQDIPQDHAIIAGVYRFAVQEKIRWVLSGGNYATESILPRAWGYNAMDARHLKAIHRRFGRLRLRTFPTISFFDFYVRFPFFRSMKVLRPLDFMPFDKAAAMQELSARFGWRYYGAKHYESVWTKFFQGYWLPVRFGFDKRRAHLSSLVVTGQMSRAEALAEMERPVYSPDEMRRDRLFIAKKLGLGEDELEALLRAPLRSHHDYPTHERFRNFVRAVCLPLPAEALRKRINRF